MMVRLEVRGLRFAHPDGGRPCLVDADVAIAPSEMLYVLGPSGSGKSTLLRLLAGDLIPDAGEVRIDGRPFGREGGGAFPEVGYQGQFPERQFFAGTVKEEVGFARDRLRERSNEEKRSSGLSVEGALELVGLGITDADLARSPWSLSEGEQRRLALASVLVFEPGVLLLDEPTTALDEAGRASLGRALAAARTRGGAAVIAAGHDLPWAVRAGADLAILTEGQLRRVDPARESDRAALAAGGYEPPGYWGFFEDRLPGFWAGGGWRHPPDRLARQWTPLGKKKTPTPTERDSRR